MEGTRSFEGVLPQSVRARYDFFETRNATRILQATNPVEFDDLIDVLERFRVDEIRDIRMPGGNESDTAWRINSAFRAHGWREGQYAVGITSVLTLKEPGLPDTVAKTENASSTYLIDNLKGRVAIDTEWHAKDGNLDRDLAAYRSLYDAGIIDVAVIVTMHRQKMGSSGMDVGDSATMTREFSLQGIGFGVGG